MSRKLYSYENILKCFCLLLPYSFKLIQADIFASTLLTTLYAVVGGRNRFDSYVQISNTITKFGEQNGE